MTWLNYHHLRYFTAVVEEQGLKRAAERLGVSHPTVSEQVRKLEAHLGLQLFERRGRRLKLTENGELVYGYAAQIFGMGSALLEAVEGRRSGRSVLCRVGVDSVLAKLAVRRMLSPVLDHFGDSLRLRCVEDERDPLITKLRGRQLDVVLTDSPAPTTLSGGLVSHRLETSALALFAAPELIATLPPRFPANLDGAPFLMPMPATRIRRELERWLGEQRIRPRIAAEMEDSGLIKAFGEQGRGVFAMPQSVSEEICQQYGVRVLGIAEGVEARVFALAEGNPPPSVEVLLRAFEE